MLSIGPWYDSNLAGLFATVLAIAATVWVTLYALRPRQALYYQLKSSSPVTESNPWWDAATRLKLQHPKILTIRLRGRGRRDVSSAAFDLNAPIAIEAGGPIFMLLGDPASSPPQRSMPEARIASGALEICPGLIGKSQLLTYTVLADVAQPSVSVRGSLIDVQIRRRDDRFETFRELGVLGFLAVLFFAINNGVFWHVHTRPFSEIKIIFHGRAGAYVMDGIVILFVLLQFGDLVLDWFD